MPSTAAFLRSMLGRRLTGIVTQRPARLFAKLAQRWGGWLAVPYRSAYFFALRLASANSPRAPSRVVLSGDAANDVRAILANMPTPPGRSHVELASGARPVGDVLSMLLMSDALSDIDVVFAHEPAAGAAPAARMSSEAWQRLRGNLSHPAFEHSVNRYLKTAHPGAFVVAVSLPVGDDGFCDGQFDLWSAALGELAHQAPQVAVLLLNPIGPALARKHFIGRRRPVFSAALAGLSVAETACLASNADAFIGVLDLFGLAARAAKRPGIYIDGFDDVSDAAKCIAHRRQITPGEAVRLFGENVTLKLRPS
jgi:hypothetical protein